MRTQPEGAVVISADIGNVLVSGLESNYSRVNYGGHVCALVLFLDVSTHVLRT